MTTETPPHVLIFGINYAPEDIGIAPYTTGLAEHLAGRDWRVTVVTGVPHYPGWRVAEGYRSRWRRREEVRGVDVVRLRHHVPPKQSAIRRGLYEATFLLNGLAPLRLPRPDVVLGVVPSLSGGVLATQAARRHGVPCGLVVQDLMANAARQSGIAGGGRVARATGSLEGWMLRRADGVAIVAELFRPTVEAFGVAPERIHHLRNWSHVGRPGRSRDAVRAELGWRPDEQIVLHAGNMGLKQALESVVVAAKLAASTRPSLRFVLMGTGSQRPMLETLGAGCPNLTFLDPQPAEAFPDVLAAADVLLVNERASVIDMSLPSKLTSYFAAGRPVVAAVPLGSTAREVVQAGAGLVVAAEEPSALLAALDRLAADPDLAARLAAAGPAFAAAHLDSAATLARAEVFLARLVGRRRDGRHGVDDVSVQGVA
ncbi:MAG: colanic acid biosynthesis glycosyl transferase WcaI [Thermomicrobiales bacterium]|jgi:glycosyltransferase involved in cell wall biosynthesis|nr:colanic acid biosynthesis glycosyl transferase WcaI [Thermomicrobiales bacterium]